MIRTKRAPKIPFVLLLGWGGQVGEDKMAAQGGVDSVVEKPIDILGLLEVISKVVRKG